MFIVPTSRGTSSQISCGKSLGTSRYTCLHIFWGWRSHTSSGASMPMSTVELWHSGGPATNSQLSGAHASNGSRSHVVSGSFLYTVL